MASNGNTAHDQGGEVFPRPQFGGPGMNLRDHLAVAALPSLISTYGLTAKNENTLAERAYALADAMLRARQG